MELKELIKYISEQVKTGKIKEDIIKDLIGAGWQQTDIDNAYQKLAQSTVNEPVKATGLAIVSKKFLLIGAGLLIVIVIAGIIFSVTILNKPAKKTRITIAPKILKQTVTQNITPMVTSLTQKVIDCGIQKLAMNLSVTSTASYATPSGTPKPVEKYPNLECFINAAKKCQMAKLMLNTEGFVNGVTTDTTVSYYITKQVNSCVLHLYQGKSTVIFPTDIPMGSINKMEESLKTFDNKEGVCSYNNNQDLAAVFENVNQGNFSVDVEVPLVGGQLKQSTMYGNGDCRGSYFDALNLVYPTVNTNSVTTYPGVTMTIKN
jgi:hypothetical protein